MPDLEIYRPRRELSRWQRTWHAVRSITLGPWNPKDPAIAKYFGGRAVSSGVSVNEQSAMNYSAVWGAVNLIAGDIAKVPLPLNKALANGGKERFKSHPLYRLMHDKPNPHMGSAVFRRCLQAWAMTWGNGVAEIERDALDRPVALWPLLPHSVEPFMDGGQPRYRIHNPTQAPTILSARDVLHIRGLGDDPYWGWSVIQKARESIGLGIAAERFGATFFGNGATFGGVLSYPPGAATNPQVREENRQALDKRHAGVENAHRLLAIYEGAKYERLGIPPNDAQFLETRQFQIEEICRWFNLPPHKLKHLARSTNNNIEHQGIEYVTDTLDPWWVIWEEELNLKLVSPLERAQQSFEHVREGLLRGDAAGRGEFYSKLFAIGAIAPNEIRARENLNPIKGGDTVYVPLNTLPLDRLEEYIDADLDAKKAKAEADRRPPPPPVAPKPADDPEKDRQIAALTEERDRARRKAQEAEDAADRAKADQVEVRALLVKEYEAHEATGKALNAVTQQRDGLVGDVNGLKQDVEALSAAVGAAEAERTAAHQRGVAVEAERDAANLKVEQLIEQLHGGLEDYKSEKTRADAAEAERDDLARRCADAETAATDLATERDEQIAKLEEARNDLVALTAAEQSALTERDMLSADIDTLRQEAADLKAERDAAKTQRAIAVTAMRGLFVDTCERLLQRESDRARKAQATPEKLRHWVETFYPLHGDLVRDAFRPVVAAWAALTAADAGAVLDRLVSAHVEQSTQAMRQVADVDDPDQMAAALERTLRRWETERASTVADALIREGMQHG